MKADKDIIIHESAVIKRPDLVVMGNHIAIDPFFYMSTGGKLGSYIHISSHVSVIGGEQGLLVMEDFTTIAAGCRIVCVSNNFADGSGFINPFVEFKYRSNLIGNTVIMRKHSALGTNVVVHPTVTIGEGSVVGSNSLVLKSTEPWGIYAGTPAVKIGERPREVLLKYENDFTM
jgi:galactoside O-acetyltransferase